MAHDYDLAIADEEMQAWARKYLHGYESNLHASHRSCNSTDGNIWKEYEAAKRYARRVKENPELRS